MHDCIALHCQHLHEEAALYYCTAALNVAAAA
jgi:hypothetical protein